MGSGGDDHRGVNPAKVRLSPFESWIVVPEALVVTFASTAARSWVWVMPEFEVRE